ncbi:MAG: serine hydrolase [Anaerolineales bacterium]|nr:serine hydrolase [Anaerolineales bacterium]
MRRGPLSALRFISLVLVLAAVVVTVLQLVRFSRVRSYLPAGLNIAGVPVGGLDRAQAAQRLFEVYSTPVELRYDGAVIHLQPSVIDFRLNTDSMLAVADLERTQKQFWQDFWDYLWGRTYFPSQIPLSANFSEPRLRIFLAEIADRYDTPAEAPQPIPGTVNFQPGKAGKALDVEGSVLLIEAALNSLDSRVIELPLQRTDPSRPLFQNLEVLLRQTLTISGFDGLAGVYLLDLQTAQEMHFAIQAGQEVNVKNEDIAFTASSIIKIPIMVSAFRRIDENADSETLKLLSDMIDKSGNEAADWLMDRVIDPQRGPLLVTQDMTALGLKNTFLAGYFSLGSPLLARIETGANSRTDVFTDPDPYSQTTISDIGMLLEDIYQCAQRGGSALTAVFPGEITQTECQAMNTYLINNRLPVLLTAGLPEATQIAHKHGWVTLNGVINTIGDAGIIYTPGGNFIMVVFLYHPTQLIWDPSSALVAELARAAYNYYNLPAQ